MSTTADGNGRRRMTQGERSAATRKALVDSTIECLVELGYDGATTTEISERALLSRGAHLHHFHTRAALLSEATAELGRRTGLNLELSIAGLPPAGRHRTEAALDMIWQLFDGPLFQAVLELAIHARTDPELRESLEAVERELNRESLLMLRGAFGLADNDDRLDELIAIATATVRGLAILPVLGEHDPAARWPTSRAMLLDLIETRLGR